MYSDGVKAGDSELHVGHAESHMTGPDLELGNKESPALSSWN